MKKINIALFALILALSMSGCSNTAQKNEKEEIIINGLVAGRTDSQLILDSDLIITGTVTDILDSKWSNPDWIRGKDVRNILQTDYIIQIDEVLDGVREKDTATVRVNKGEDEETIVISDGYPDFEIGEAVLLFLSIDESDIATDEDYYVVTGMKQGKLSLSDEAIEGQLSSLPTAIYANDSRSFELSELKTRIAAEHAANPNYKEEQAIRQQQIIEQNKLLFGE